jgi:hypothetical protein
MREAVTTLLNRPSWCGAQLKEKSTGKTLPFIEVTIIEIRAIEQS